MPDHSRKPGASAAITRDEILARVARFSCARTDEAAFPDIDSGGHQREVRYLLSTDNLAGPAPINAPHNFHLAVLTMKPGVRPVVHAHPYNEVFMPVDGPFRFFWGDEAGRNDEDCLELGALDVISIPAGVHRTFENIGEQPAHVIAIFDIAGDPHIDMRVPPDVYEEFYSDGWVPPNAGGKGD